MAPSRGFVWHHSWLDKLLWVWKVKAQDSCLEEGLVDCHKISVGDTHVDSSSISHAVETNSLESKSEGSSSEFQLELNDERSQKLDYSKPKRKHSVDRLEDYRPHGTIVMTEFIFDAEESHCSKMFLCGDWNDWEPIPMVATRDAAQWSTIIPVPIGYHEFGFVTDKGVWKWSRKHPWNETKRCHWRRIRGPSKSQKWKDNLSPSWWTLFCCIPLFILLWIMIALERFKALFVDDTVVLSECDHLVNECLQEQQSSETTDSDSWWIASQDCMFQCALKVCKMFPRTDILIIRELHWKRLFLVAITVYTLGRFLPEILWVLLQ